MHVPMYYKRDFICLYGFARDPMLNLTYYQGPYKTKFGIAITAAWEAAPLTSSLLNKFQFAFAERRNHFRLPRFLLSRVSDYMGGGALVFMRLLLEYGE